MDQNFLMFQQNNFQLDQKSTERLGNGSFYPSQKNNRNFENMDLLKLYKDSTEFEKRSLNIDK